MLRLASREIDQIQALLHLLHGPLAAPDLSGWRVQVTRAMRALLATDGAVFALPLPGIEPIWNEMVDPQAAVDYLSYFAALDPGHENRRRLGLAVCSRRMIYPESIRETELYHDFFRRYGLEDAVTLNHDQPDGSTAWLALSRRDHFDPATEERALSILKLLLPAFQAGVRSCLLVGHEQTQLASSIDRLPDGAALCDAGGRLVHANPTLRGMLSGKHEARLLAELRETAAAIASLRLPGEDLRSEQLKRLGARDVRIGSSLYRVHGTWIGAAAGWLDALVMVVVERIDRPRLVTRAELRSRFGLTPREAEVTLLLGGGMGAKRVAQELGISWHTARRHIESIMRKLDVRSRAEIWPTLQRTLERD